MGVKHNLLIEQFKIFHNKELNVLHRSCRFVGIKKVGCYDGMGLNGETFW